MSENLRKAYKINMCVVWNSPQADLFNTLTETSQFPDLWKFASATLIFREGDKAEMSNHRPISVLPITSKLFDKLIAKDTNARMIMVISLLSNQGFCVFILL